MAESTPATLTPETSRWRGLALGLGGNLGDVPTTIRRAVDRLRADPQVRIDRVSSLYRTAPWGPVAQPDFCNACALGATDHSPRALLSLVKRLEHDLGRESSERWGPRAIDIDILHYEGDAVDEPDLVIPHRSLFERAFVLVPLAEIAPDLVIAGHRVADAARALGASGIRRWSER